MPFPTLPSEAAAAAADLLGRTDFPPAGAPLTCAVSGGPDSLALLVLATAAGCRATAVHVDHGLRQGSAREADVVEEAARLVGAGFRAVSVEVRPGPNLEARARAARRRVLPEDAATGHTADDQAETVLINLLRGAGLDGLAGMEPGPRHPILRLRRADTRRLCELAGLTPVHDPSNDDPAHLRNRVRHQLLPLLDRLAGRDVAAVLARQAGLLAADAALLEELAAGLDPTSARQLAAAPPPLARRALRRWLLSADGYPPPAAALERVMDVVHHRAVAAEVGGGVTVRRSGGRLRVERGAGGGCEVNGGGEAAGPTG